MGVVSGCGSGGMGAIPEDSSSMTGMFRKTSGETSGVFARQRSSTSSRYTFNCHLFQLQKLLCTYMLLAHNEMFILPLKFNLWGGTFLEGIASPGLVGLVEGVLQPISSQALQPINSQLLPQLFRLNSTTNLKEHFHTG